MLAKRYRLTKNGSFSYLYRQGTRVAEHKVRLNFVHSKSGVRVGFSVSNKIGKAVVRNKVKRRMRAVIAPLVGEMKPCQAVFVVSPGVDALSFSELKAVMTSCLRRAELIAGGENE